MSCYILANCGDGGEEDGADLESPLLLAFRSSTDLEASAHCSRGTYTVLARPLQRPPKEELSMRHTDSVLKMRTALGTHQFTGSGKLP